MPGAYWRSLIHFEPERIARWTGLCNAFGVILALGAGTFFENPSSGLVMAIGALNTGYSDGQDSYVHRARRMSPTALLCGCAVCGGGLAAENHFAAIALSTVFAFGAGMLVALGATAAEVGMITPVTFLVFSSQIMPAPKALLSGVLALAGGIVQTALAVALWRVHRYRKEREALADLDAELVRAVREPAPAAEAPSGTAQSTRAQQVLGALASEGSIESERYLALLSQTERIRLTLLAPARLRGRIARLQAAGTAELDRSGARAAIILGALENLLRSGKDTKELAAALADLGAVAEHLREAAPTQPVELKALFVDARHNLDSLTGQLRAAWDLASHSMPAGLSTFQHSEAERPWWLRLGGPLAILRANLAWRSPAFRHALRLAVCVTAGIALGRALNVPRSY
jgi:uncharacterized membrane protein YccC